MSDQHSIIETVVLAVGVVEVHRGTNYLEDFCMYSKFHIGKPCRLCSQPLTAEFIEARRQQALERLQARREANKRNQKHIRPRARKYDYELVYREFDAGKLPKEIAIDTGYRMRQVHQILYKRRKQMEQLPHKGIGT